MKNQGLLITILIAVSLLLSVNASKAEQYYYYDLGASGFSVPAYGSHSINDSGYISGGTWGPGGTTAALWSPSGVIQNFGTPDGSCAVGINNKNEVVGYSADFFAGYNKAFKWTKTDGIKDLGSLSGKGGYAYGINDSGSVVGTSEAGGQSSHAFLWTPSSGMQDLGILGGQYSSASSINNSGSVVGSSDFDNIAYTRTAFLWTSSAGMKNINDLINNKPSNTYLVSASSINNKNQIVGTLNAPLPNGNSYSAYLWSGKPHKSRHPNDDPVDGHLSGWGSPW
ncbi:MAG: hypothetical protein NTY19_21630 [Planctomycetota bacterium]|nr:hypothetical protein [Planctomycetota bacterium]